MTDLRIPKYLAELARRPKEAALREWIAALPAVIAQLTERWELQLGEPYEPGGQCSWVAPARDAQGHDLVLKVGLSHAEAAHESDALRLWHGEGAVKLHAAVEFGQTSALLLERCIPGTRLDRSVPEPDQDAIVAGLLRRLWRPPPDGHRFRPLQVMCDEWAAEFDGKLANAPGTIDAGLAREGMTLFRTLPRTATASVVLCTDLHGGNILRAAREPWLVIDPKPYVGDPHYDALQHMFNCTVRLRADPMLFVHRMADLLALDAERLRLWLFARCVQESPDHGSLAGVAARIAP